MKPKNFIFILFISELIWLVLYVLSILLGSLYCDISLLSLSFFILGFAGLEFSFGMLISILYKNLNESLNLEYNNKINSQNVLNKELRTPIDTIS